MKSESLRKNSQNFLNESQADKNTINEELNIPEISDSSLIRF